MELILSEIVIICHELVTFLLAHHFWTLGHLWLQGRNVSLFLPFDLEQCQVGFFLRLARYGFFFVGTFEISFIICFWDILYRMAKLLLFDTPLLF